MLRFRVENANEGIDTVQMSLPTPWVANVENLTLTGTSSVTARATAWTICSRATAGQTVLTGGLGNDTYVMSTSIPVVENANEGNRYGAKCAQPIPWARTWRT